MSVELGSQTANAIAAPLVADPLTGNFSIPSDAYEYLGGSFENPFSYQQNGTTPATPPGTMTTVVFDGGQFANDGGTAGLLVAVGNGGGLLFGTLVLTGVGGAGPAIEIAAGYNAFQVTNGAVIDAGTAAVIVGGATAGVLSVSGTLRAGVIEVDALGTLRFDYSSQPVRIDGVINLRGGTIADSTFQALTLTNPITLSTGANEIVGNTSGFFVTGSIAGTGSLICDGVVILTNTANSFSGGLTIAGGTLDLTAPGAAGTGPIRFAKDQNATLRIEAGSAPTQTIFGLSVFDTIEVAGSPPSTDTITLTSNNGGTVLLPVSDGVGGTTFLTLGGLSSQSVLWESSNGAVTDYQLLATAPRILTATGTAGAFAAAGSWLEMGTLAATPPDTTTAAVIIDSSETLGGGGTAGEVALSNSNVTLSAGTIRLAGLSQPGVSQPIAIVVSQGQLLLGAGAVVDAPGALVAVDNYGVLTVTDGASLTAGGLALTNATLMLGTSAQVTAPITAESAAIMATGTGATTLSSTIAIGASVLSVRAGTGTLVLTGALTDNPADGFSGYISMETGTLVLTRANPGFHGVIYIVGGAAVVAADGAAAGIHFSGAGQSLAPQTLVIQTATSLSTPITGLDVNTVIDLPGLTGTVSLASTFSSLTGSAVVTANDTIGHSVTFTLGNADPGNTALLASPDGHGGTQIQLLDSGGADFTFTRHSNPARFGDAGQWMQGSTISATEPDVNSTALFTTPGTDVVTGALITGHVVVSSGDQVVLTNGSISAATRFALSNVFGRADFGGGLTIDAGGTVSLGSGDFGVGIGGIAGLTVQHGGTLIATSIDVGPRGSLRVDASASLGLTGAIVLAGGTLTAIGGATVTAPMVSTSAVGTLAAEGGSVLALSGLSPGFNAVTIGHVLINGLNVTFGAFQVDNGSTLEFGPNSSPDANLAFDVPPTASTGGTIQIDGTAPAYLTVAGFTGRDVIDLRGIAPSQLASVAISSPGTASAFLTLTKTDGSNVSINLIGENYLDSTFTTADDGQGGTRLIVAQGSASVLEFAPTGSSIANLGQVGNWNTISPTGQVSPTTAIPDASTVAYLDAATAQAVSGQAASGAINGARAVYNGQLTAAAIVFNTQAEIVGGTITVSGSTDVALPGVNLIGSMYLIGGSTLSSPNAPVVIGNNLFVLSGSTLVASSIKTGNSSVAGSLLIDASAVITAPIDLSQLSIEDLSSSTRLFGAFTAYDLNGQLGGAISGQTSATLASMITLGTQSSITQTNGVVVIPGSTLNLTGVISDDVAAHAAPLSLRFGTVVLSNPLNSFGGGVVLSATTLDLVATNAAGHGDIVFNSGQSAFGPLAITGGGIGSATGSTTAASFIGGSDLRIEPGVTFSNRIDGFGPGQIIDLGGISPTEKLTVYAAPSGTNTVLTVSGGGQTATLLLGLPYVTTNIYDVRADGLGGTDIVFVARGAAVSSLASASASGAVDISNPSAWLSGIPGAGSAAVFGSGSTATIAGSASIGEAIVSDRARIEVANGTILASGLSDGTIANVGLRVDLDAALTIDNSGVVDLGTADAMIGDGTNGQLFLTNHGSLLASNLVVGLGGTLGLDGSVTPPASIILAGGTLAAVGSGAVTIGTPIQDGFATLPSVIIGGSTSPLVLLGGLFGGGLQSNAQAVGGVDVAGGTVVIATTHAVGFSPAAAAFARGGTNANLSIGDGLLELATRLAVPQTVGFDAGLRGTLRIDPDALTSIVANGTTSYILGAGATSIGEQVNLTTAVGLAQDAGGNGIVGLSGSGTVEVTSFKAVGTVGVIANATLTLTDAAGDTLSLFTPDFTAGQVALGDDGRGGTTIVTTVACFLAGTRILTRRGEVPVETLLASDRVYSPLHRRFVPVVWVGHREIDLARHPSPAQARPVRIRAGAFGPGVPHRDLLVSPEHMILVEDQLVPARALVNFDSIAWAAWITVPHYVHVELPSHDIVLAEGLAAESWLDTGNRSMFANVPMPDLHADFAPGADFAARACRPVVTDVVALEMIRQHVLTLASGFSSHPVATDLDHYVM